jgi:hypothetical protein
MTDCTRAFGFRHGLAGDDVGLIRFDGQVGCVDYAA